MKQEVVITDHVLFHINRSGVMWEDMGRAVQDSSNPFNAITVNDTKIFTKIMI